MSTNQTCVFSTILHYRSPKKCVGGLNDIMANAIYFKHRKERYNFIIFDYELNHFVSTTKRQKIVHSKWQLLIYIVHSHHQLSAVCHGFTVANQTLYCIKY